MFLQYIMILKFLLKYKFSVNNLSELSSKSISQKLHISQEKQQFYKQLDFLRFIQEFKRLNRQYSPPATIHQYLSGAQLEHLKNIQRYENSLTRVELKYLKYQLIMRLGLNKKLNQENYLNKEGIVYKSFRQCNNDESQQIIKKLQILGMQNIKKISA